MVVNCSVFTFHWVSDVTLTVPSPSDASSWCGVAISHWNELSKSSFFANYANVFGQVRIDSIRAKITGAPSSNSFLCPLVVLAFDRSGLSPDSVDTGGESKEVNLTPDASFLVSTHPNSRIYSWFPGNSFHAFQSIDPTTLAERSMYVSTEELANEYVSGKAGKPSTLTSPFADPSHVFKPQTLIAVHIPVASTEEGPSTFTFTVELSYVVTFRGL